MVERARAPRPSVSDLESLLSEVPRLAYDPVEVSYLTKVLDEARGISAHVTRVFPHVAWSPTVRGGMTLILRKNATSSNTNLRKSTLMELQSLLSSIHSCPVKLVERDRLVEHLIHAEKWISRCHHAIDSQNRNLKDLASLASEAESIPIDLSSHVAKLADAITTAQDWMTRVRKAVPRSSKTRKGKGEDNVDLATLKSLLTEGSSSGESGTTTALSNVADIVVRAEEWLSRAKVALEKRSEVETDELKTFLREVDDIPVAMVEITMLQVEIESRAWSDNMRTLLGGWVPATAVVMKEGEGEGGKVIGERKILSIEVKDMMTQQTLDDIVGEAEGIRSMLPPGPIRDGHVIVLEKDALHLRELVGTWIKNVDQYLSPSSHSPLTDLVEHVRIGKDYPIDFEGRIEGLGKKIIDAEEWITKAKGMLQIVDGHLKRERQRAEAGEMSWTHAAVAAEEELAVGMLEIPSLKILQTTVSEIRSIGISTEEEATMSRHVKDVQSWLDRAKRMLPKMQRKKASNYVKPSMSDFIQTCDESRNLAVPCTDVVLSLCAEMDNSKTWLSEAASLLRASDVAMSKAMSSMAATAPNSAPNSALNSAPNSAPNSALNSDPRRDDDPQMDVVREFYEQYVDLKKRADASLAVSSPEENLLLLRIDAAEWAESADTALTQSSSDHFPLDVALRLKKEGEHLVEVDQKFSDPKLWPEDAPLGADGGGWRMGTHERLLHRIVDAYTSGNELTSLIQTNMGAVKGVKSGCVASTLIELEGLLSRTSGGQCVDTKLLNLFRQRVRKAKLCNDVAQKVCLKWNHELPSIEQVQKSLDQAASLSLILPAQEKMQIAFDGATSWEKKLRESGIETGQAPVDLLKSLLVESKSIQIDLSAHVSVLEQATKEYCMCKAPSDGWMIGCESCDDWFHGRCIGLKEEDNVEDYVCPRCSVFSFFKANVIAFRHVYQCYSAMPKDATQFTILTATGTALGQAGMNVKAAGVKVEAAAGEAMAGEATTGEATTGEAAAGEAEAGEAAAGEAEAPAEKVVSGGPHLAAADVVMADAAVATSSVAVDPALDTVAGAVVDTATDTTADTGVAEAAPPLAETAAAPSAAGDAMGESVAESTIIRLDQSKSYDAPAHDSRILELLRRSDILLCSSDDAFDVVEMFHCDQSKMDEFFLLCTFIMDHCPQCELTARIAEWLKLQIWVSSALNILSHRPELKAITELLNTCVHIPMSPGGGMHVLASLQRLATEGQKWGERIEKAINNTRRVKSVLTRKDLDDAKRVLDAVTNLPIVHPLEEHLRGFYRQEKTKYEKMYPSTVKRPKSSGQKRSSGGKGSRGGKKAKTSSSSSSAASSASSGASSAASSAASSSASTSSSTATSSNSRKKKRGSSSESSSIAPGLKRRKLHSKSKVGVGTKLKARIIEDGVPMIYSAIIKE